MGFGKRLRVQRSADGRVLKSQLDMTAEALRATRISAPAWCLFIAVLASDQIGLIGHMPLLTTLIDEATRRGVAHLDLEVRADNESAQRLYERHGFTKIAVRRDYYQPSGTDAVVMRKELVP